MTVMVVHAGYDDEARVWYVQHSELPGVHAEGDTFDALADKLPNVVRDLMEVAGTPIEHDVLIEIIAHTSARVPA